MDKKTIHQHAHDQFEDVRLSDEQLAQLKACAQLPTESAFERLKNNIYNKPAYASLYLNGLVACVVFLLAFILFAQPTDLHLDLAEEISHEVVSNHILLKPLEVKTSEMSDIKKHFTELQFNPIVSKVFSSSNGQLLGGRYCSIKRALAVQLRYDAGNGKSSTLYETSYHPKTFSSLPNVDKGEKPIEHRLQGLRVKLWVEKGLVLASVTE